MKIQDIQLLYDYNYWANNLILDAAARVTPAQLTAPNSHNFGSLRGTLVHALDAEWGWRMLLQHGTSTDILVETEFVEIQPLVEHWQAEEKEMRAYLASLSDEDLEGVISYTTDEGEVRERLLWHGLVHVVNHGTQHRSEAAVMLTDAGQSPGELDFTVFLSQRN